jgi:hypothetical protein
MAARAQLINPYSSNYYSFTIIVNSNKIEKDSVKYKQIQRLIYKKHNSNLVGSSASRAASGTTSFITWNYMPLTPELIRAALSPCLNSSRLCVKISKEYAIESCVNCDFLVYLASTNPDGSEVIAGFASVMYNVYGLAYKNPAFVIDLICSDILVSGPGLCLINFFKSILLMEYNDDSIALERRGIPLVATRQWYSIYLESIQDADTLEFYKNRSFVRARGVNGKGLIPHSWDATVHYQDEWAELSHAYSRNHNIQIYKNSMLAADAMDWAPR